MGSSEEGVGGRLVSEHWRFMGVSPQPLTQNRKHLNPPQTGRGGMSFRHSRPYRTYAFVAISQVTLDCNPTLTQSTQPSQGTICTGRSENPPKTRPLAPSIDPEVGE